MVRTAAIDDGTMLRRKAAVVSADVADDAILLDIDSGYFFQLNRTGTRIWTFVEAPQTLGALCDHMIVAGPDIRRAGAGSPSRTAGSADTSSRARRVAQMPRDPGAS